MSDGIRGRLLNGGGSGPAHYSANRQEVARDRKSNLNFEIPGYLDQVNVERVKNIVITRKLRHIHIITTPVFYFEF